jgi:hypothetical protein
MRGPLISPIQWGFPRIEASSKFSKGTITTTQVALAFQTMESSLRVTKCHVRTGQHMRPIQLSRYYVT